MLSNTKEALNIERLMLQAANLRLLAAAAIESVAERKRKRLNDDMLRQAEHVLS